MVAVRARARIRLRHTLRHIPRHTPRHTPSKLCHIQQRTCSTYRRPITRPVPVPNYVWPHATLDIHWDPKGVTAASLALACQNQHQHRLLRLP
ncbi:hypothetical protein KP79_PYT22929 [Mizuhopecten yessoensis]|uniref:Uncharacterized protein n=1 Tax=Mizuhopecten yessoensis TaxID=6573 RepID=A0A210QXN7_MIZYE|nr:hypothetical protein KP79_PYT22929 [Mizuhopecten yessoensis]